MDVTTAAPAAPDHRTATRTWRLVAVAICLGVLAAIVPDDASSRQLALAGLTVLALGAAASVVLVRRGRRSLVPSRSTAVGPAPVLPTAMSDPGPEAERVAPAPAPAPAPALAEPGDPYRVFLVENSGRPPVQEPLSSSGVDLPEAALPAPLASTAPRLEPASSPDIATRWVPLGEEVRSTLQAGWPFVSRGGANDLTDTPADAS